MTQLALPPVDRTAIEQALKHFDQEFRDTKGWFGWKENQAHRYLQYVDQRSLAL